MNPAPPVTMTTFISVSGAHFRVRKGAEASLDAYELLKVSDSIIAGAMTVEYHGLGYFEIALIVFWI